MATEKTLKLKRIFAYIIHQRLKTTPSKDFSTGELKALITDIIPSLRTHIDEYVKLADQATDVRNNLGDKATPEEVVVAMEPINKEWREYGKVSGVEIVDVILNDEAFKALNSIFDKETGGKEWAGNLDEYAELLNAFTEAAK